MPFEMGPPPMEAGTAEHNDLVRGRTRHRSTTRAQVKPIRTDESSTLRGRSRRRATSPFGGLASRNSSPSLMDHARARLLRDRLRETRREHCPSRPVSPSRRNSRMQRGERTPHTRSRSRGLRAERGRDRYVEGLSSLRNEVILDNYKTPAIQENDFGTLGKTKQ